MTLGESSVTIAPRDLGTTARRSLPNPAELLHDSGRGTKLTEAKLAYGCTGSPCDSFF